MTLKRYQIKYLEIYLLHDKNTKINKVIDFVQKS